MLRRLPAFVTGSVAITSLAYAQSPSLSPTVTFKGHTDPIYAVTVSPDGRYAATGSFDKTIKLWDPSSGKEIRTLAGKSGHQNQVLTLAFSPDGSLLASGGSDNQVKLWDVPTGRPAMQLAAAKARAIVSPDGKQYLTGSGDGTIQLWTAADGKLALSVKSPAPIVGLGFTQNGQTIVTAGADKTLRYWSTAKLEPLGSVGVGAPITGVAINAGNGTVITTSADGSLKVWPGQLPALPKPLAPFPAVISELTLSADGSTLLAAGSDKLLRTINTSTRQPGAAFSPAPSAITASASGGPLVAAGTLDGKITIWGADGKAKVTIPAHTGAVQSLALLGNGQTLLSVGADGTVRQGTIPASSTTVAHPDKVSALVTLPDGKRVATAGGDKIVRIVNAGQIEKPLAGHEAPVTALAVATDTLISADAAGTINLWTIANGQKSATVAGLKKPVTAIVPQPGTKGFAVVYASGEVQFWSDAKAKEAKLLAHPGAVVTASFSADGKKLLTLAADKNLRSWAVDTAKSDAPVALTLGTPKAASFSTDRSKIVIASSEPTGGKVSILPSNAGAKPTYELAVPGEIEAMLVNPAGTRIAVATSTKEARRVLLLDAASPKILQIVAEPTAIVRDLAFLPDGKSLAVAHDGKQLEVHDLWVTTALATTPGLTAATIASSGTQIVTVGADKIAHLWDLASQKELKTFGPLASPAKAVILSRDGTTISVAESRQVKSWTVADGKELPAVAASADITSLAISPDKTKLIVGQADSSATLVDIATGQPMQTATVGGATTAVTFHPSLPYFLVAAADKTVSAHPIALTKSVKDPAAIGAALVLAPAGTPVFTAGTGRGVTVWNSSSWVKEKAIDLEGPVTALAVSKNNQLLAVAHLADPNISLVNLADGAILGKFKVPTKVSELAFHPTLPVLAGVQADQKIVLWNVAYEAGQPLPPEFGKPIQDLPHPAATTSLAFSPDGAQILSGADDANVRIWKFASDQPVKTLAHPNLVDAVAFDKTGTLLATVAHDGILRIFDVAKGTALKTINAHTTPSAQPVYSVVWDPQSKMIATSCFDKTIKLWDATSGNLIREIKPGSDRLPIDPKLGQGGSVVVGALGSSVLNAPPSPGHLDQVFTLAFTPDGKALASGSSDRTIKLWNVANGELIREFRNTALPPAAPGLPPTAHPGFVHHLRITPDGTRLISVGNAPRGQGYFAVWSLADGKLITGIESPLGPIYAIELLPGGQSAVLGCGPKNRFQSESDALVVPIPAK